jgi:DNA-binding HxlR family transcriptional regulator
MVLLDLLGRRTALRILWELRGDAPLTFRALQGAAETNPSVLNTRLAELREVQIVAHTEGGYALSPLGRELLAHLGPLHVWSEKWAKAIQPPRGR